MWIGVTNNGMLLFLFDELDELDELIESLQKSYKFQPILSSGSLPVADASFGIINSSSPSLI